MTTYTTRGVPLAETTDAADIAARINPVAQLIHDRPGVAAVTTAQRDAFTGTEVWDGRLIVNTTLDRVQRYDSGTSAWVLVADFSEIAAMLTSSTPLGLSTTGAIGTATTAARADHRHPYSDQDNILPSAHANASSTQTRIHKRDRVGFLHMEATPTATLTTSSVWFTVPAGYRPTTRAFFIAPAGGTNYLMMLNTDGVVTCISHNAAASVIAYGTTAYELA